MAVKPLFVEYKNCDYEIILTESDLKILSYSEPIKLDSEYVNEYEGTEEATEDNIRNYEGHPVFTDLKDDMETMSNKICNSLKSLPYVEDAFTDRSGRVGISTYITIKFKHPTLDDVTLTSKEREQAEYDVQHNPQYITHFNSGFGNNEGLEGEFNLEIRLSSHPVVWSTAYIDINILGKVYQYFKKRVISRVKERWNYILTAWKQYVKTGKLPKNQRRRNITRKNHRDNGQPVIFEHIKNSIFKSLKESFGGVRLQSIIEKEAENILSYLDMNDIKLEDIVSAVEVEFKDEKIIYAELLAILADCLVDNIIEYIFDGGFDYELLFDDMRERIYNE